jgi:hypothetical protein
VAQRDLRHPAGAEGPWFVDDRWIDCDAARQPPPGVFPVFPHDLGDGVHRLGHNALDSFSAHAYLVMRDDVADADRYAEHFDASV